jgi:hypothetical protein
MSDETATARRETDDAKVGIVMTVAEARRLTDEARAKAAELWDVMLRLYRGGAHVALGYASWSLYCAAEFDIRKATAYRLVTAAEIVETLASLPGETPPPTTERVARELAPLRDDPAALAEAWEDANATAADRGEPVTATVVRETVQRKRGDFRAELEAAFAGADTADESDAKPVQRRVSLRSRFDAMVYWVEEFESAADGAVADGLDVSDADLAAGIGALDRVALSLRAVLAQRGRS